MSDYKQGSSMSDHEKGTINLKNKTSTTRALRTNIARTRVIPTVQLCNAFGTINPMFRLTKGIRVITCSFYTLYGIGKINHYFIAV